MNKQFVQLGLMAGGTLLVGVTAAFWGKLDNLSKKLDTSVKGLKDLTADKIKDAIVEKAIKEAADEQVSGYIAKVQNEVMASAKEKLNDEARRAVKEAQNDIQSTVAERISKEAELIDIDDLRKTVRKKAEERIVNKFDGSLDDLLGKFNENLGNVQRIYGGIANAIGNANKATKEIKFSLD